MVCSAFLGDCQQQMKSCFLLIHLDFKRVLHSSAVLMVAICARCDIFGGYCWAAQVNDQIVS